MLYALSALIWTVLAISDIVIINQLNANNMLIAHATLAYLCIKEALDSYNKQRG